MECIKTYLGNDTLSRIKGAVRILSIIACVVFVMFLIVFSFSHIFLSPSNDRDWSLEARILPSITVHDDEVTIRNIRNFLYTDATTYKPNYYNSTFNLSDIISVDLIETDSYAETLVSFGFVDGSYLTVSIEARNELDESFSQMKGLLNQFELAYTFVDEKDILTLRAIHQHKTIRLYPVRGTHDQMQSLFTSMLTRAHTLTETPEFYNSLTNTNNTNVRTHLNRLIDPHLLNKTLIRFPSEIGTYAYKYSLIDTNLSNSELQRAQTINTAITEYADDPHFSQKIREGLKPLPLD